MDAFSTEAINQSYSDEHAALLVASSEAAMFRAEKAVEASGLRVGGKLSIERAHERLERQGAVSAIWVEVDRDCGRPMDDLLTLLNREAADGRYAAVVSTTAPEMLDALEARLQEGAVELLINADDVERVASLAAAAAKRQMRLRIVDVASDKNAERLRQLSEEVSRIASTLARLSAGPGTTRPPLESLPSGDVPPLPAETVRTVIRARRLRGRYFDETLFADPAWDMMLDLLQSEIAQHRVPVSSLCIAAAVPATTALRWLKTMVSQGLFVRRADPHDGRRVFVELAPEASQALRRYFAEVGQVATI
jgi:hypothetical protein